MITFSLGILPVPFILIGLGFLYFQHFFKRNGKKINGKVIAYEKYLSKTSLSNNNTQGKQLFYAPIIEFQFTGQTKYLKGAGSNHFLYRLGKKIELRVLDENANQVLPMTFNLPLFGIFFLAFGLGFLFVFFNRVEIDSWQFCIPIILLFSLPWLLIEFLKRKNLLEQAKIDLLKNSSIFEEFDPKNFLSSQEDISKEKKSHKKVGLIISFLFFGFTSWIANLLWKKIPLSNKEIIFDPAKWSKISVDPNNPTEYIFGFVLFMLIVMTFSIIKQLRQ